MLLRTVLVTRLWRLFGRGSSARVGLVSMTKGWCRRQRATVAGGFFLYVYILVMGLGRAGFVSLRVYTWAWSEFHVDA